MFGYRYIRLKETFPVSQKFRESLLLCPTSIAIKNNADAGGYGTSLNRRDWRICSQFSLLHE